MSFVNTYRLWLICELYRHTPSEDQLAGIKNQLVNYVQQSKATNPHLQAAMDLIEARQAQLGN